MNNVVPFVVHDADGMVLRAGTAPPGMVAMQAMADGETAVQVDDTSAIGDCTHRLVQGELVKLPARPSPAMRYDVEAGAWFDPRTPDDLTAELDARRAAAALTKNEFLQACMSVGLLTPKEAAVAARGNIPESFASAVAGMGAEMQDRVSVAWPASTRVERMDPLILAVAAARSIAPETLDEIFDVRTA